MKKFYLCTIDDGLFCGDPIEAKSYAEAADSVLYEMGCFLKEVTDKEIKENNEIDETYAQENGIEIDDN